MIDKMKLNAVVLLVTAMAPLFSSAMTEKELVSCARKDFDLIEGYETEIFVTFEGSLPSVFAKEYFAATGDRAEKYREALKSAPTCDRLRYTLTQTSKDLRAKVREYSFGSEIPKNEVVFWAGVMTPSEFKAARPKVVEILKASGFNQVAENLDFKHTIIRQLAFTTTVVKTPLTFAQAAGAYGFKGTPSQVTADALEAALLKGRKESVQAKVYKTLEGCKCDWQSDDYN